jgi:hypothetical protein
VTRTINRMISPEGWMGLKMPVTIQYFRLMSELIGKKCLDSGGPGNRRKNAVFQLFDEQAEFYADEKGDRQKCVLDDLAMQLDVMPSVKRSI